jgi:hypothetical protein
MTAAPAQLGREVVAIIAPDWRPSPDAEKTSAEIETRLLAAPLALERATALAAWKKIWETVNPNRRRGGDRRSTSFRTDVSKSNNWTLIAAERLRLGRSTILADVALCEQLGLPDVERLWDSPINNDGHALRQFAGLQPRQRDAVYRRMCAHPTQAWEDWLRAERLKPELASEDAQVNLLYDAWKAAGAKARRRFLAQIGFDSADADKVVRPLKGAAA